MPGLIQILSNAGINEVSTSLDVNYSMSLSRPFEEAKVSLLINKIELEDEDFNRVVNLLRHKSGGVRVYLKDSDQPAVMKYMEALILFAIGVEVRTMREFEADINDDYGFTDIFLCMDDCKHSVEEVLDRLRMEKVPEEDLTDFLKAKMFIEISKRPKFWVFISIDAGPSSTPPSRHSS
jgi:hypothetical protein